MAENDLTGKVGLDTTDFKTAIAEMNREIRVIESGFRASAAALGDWGKSADGLELRIKSLTQSIGVQEQKVASLRAEYERVATEKGVNSKAAQDLEIRLNKETETLNKMGNELGQAETALSDMGNAAGDLAKDEEEAEGATSRLSSALGKLKGGLSGVASDFRDLGDRVLKGVALGITGVVAGIAGAATGIVAAGLKTAATADNIVESAEKLGISAEQYQEFQFIGDQVGTSVEAIGKAFSKTTKLIGDASGGNKDAVKTFKDLGVSITDANGNLRSSQDVTFDLITALGGMTDETQQDILAQQLFGKGFQELAPLINLGADGAKKMTEQARAMGAVMSEDAVNAAADLNDKIGALKAGFQGIVARLAGSFMPIMSKVVDVLMAWLANPQIQAGLNNFINGITAVIDRVMEFPALLGEGFTPLEAIGEILKTFIPPEFAAMVDQAVTTIQDLVKVVVTFVTTHAEEIKGALIGIGAVLAGAGIVAGIAAIGGVIASLVSPIGIIIAAAGLLGAAWAGNWGGIREKTQAAWAAVKPIFDQLVAWLKVNIPLAIQTVSNFWTGTLQPALVRVWQFIQTNVIPVFQQIVTWLATNIPPAIQTLADFWTGTLLPAINTVWEFFNANILPILQSVADIMNDALSLAVTALAGLWQNVLQPALNSVWQFIQDNILPVFTTLSDFINNTVGPALLWFKSTVIDPLASSLKTGLVEALDWVNQRLQDFKEWLGSITLPAWLTPGSPTPFELGLRGITDAMDELNKKQLHVMAAQFSSAMAVPAPMGAGSAAPGAAGSTIIDASTIEENTYFISDRKAGASILAHREAQRQARLGRFVGR